jgi:antitoxin Phd
MKSWQLQDAKAQLSKVVKEAMTHGPQEISVRGESAVIVISRKTYDQLVKPKPSFVEFIRQSPLVNTKIRLDRDKSLTRDIKL